MNPNESRFEDERCVWADRRSLLRAGVWGVPTVVLASAAPAFAGSTVSPGFGERGLFDMSNGTVNATRDVFTVAASGLSVPLTLTIAVVPPAGPLMGLPNGTNRNYAVEEILTGPPSESGLLLQHHDFDEPFGVAHTLTFSRAVSHLNVRLAGIGYDNNGQDQFSPAGFGFSRVPLPDSVVGGSGRWFFTSTYVQDITATDPRGHLLLDHPDTLTAEVFRFGSGNYNGAGSGGAPPNVKEMYIGGISFTVA